MQDLISRESAKERFNDIPPFIGMTGGCVQQMLDTVADANAIQLPPVNIGDTAFFVIDGNVYEAKICLMQWCKTRYGTTSEIRGEVYSNHSVSAKFEDWGKLVFASKDDADKVRAV